MWQRGLPPEAVSPVPRKRTRGRKKGPSRRSGPTARPFPMQLSDSKTYNEETQCLQGVAGFQAKAV